jgi:alkylated DNA repair protein alkB family protein 4
MGCEAAGARYRFCAFGQARFVTTADEVVATAVERSYADAAIVACNFTGVTVVPEFVSAGDEAIMLHYFDGRDWKPSQSGRRKQDFGPSVNFKRQKVKMVNFEGLPKLSRLVIKSMVERVECLDGFVPVECGVIDYDPIMGAAIDRHQDDKWLWGERIATLSLLAASVMTFSFDTRHGQDKTDDNFPLVEVRVALPERSLLVMQGEARNTWSHAVLRQDITARRVSVTFRELASAFLPGGDFEAEGHRLVEKASTFNG